VGFISGEGTAKDHVIDVLARVPAMTYRRIYNVFPVETEVQIIMIRSESVDSDYLVSGKRAAGKPGSGRQGRIEEMFMI